MPRLGFGARAHDLARVPRLCGLLSWYVDSGRFDLEPPTIGGLLRRVCVCA
jgi:hypothetical protein